MFVFTYYGKCQELSKIVEIGKCQILSILGKIGNCQMLSNFGKKLVRGWLFDKFRASANAPTLGRLYHKTAALSRKNFRQKKETVSSFHFQIMTF